MKHLHPNILPILALCSSLLALTPATHAQEKVDPFDPNTTKENPGRNPESFQIIYEVFSLPITEAAALLRSAPSDPEFYTKMVEGVRAQKITQEVFLMGRGLPGNQFTIEQVSAHIYNTEVYPPELPNETAGGPGFQQNGKGIVAPAAFPVTPATPGKFETKNVGDSLEVEVQLDQDRLLVELRLSASTVSLVRRDTYGQGMSKTEMPRFANQKITTGVTLLKNVPSFLGTISPPEDLQPEKGADRIWFAFIHGKFIAQ